MPRGRPPKLQLTDQGLLKKFRLDFKDNTSLINLILGVLIVLVLGVLIFNYLNRPAQDLGPSQQIERGDDVLKDQLPGKYTVKAGDTLFLIAQQYYDDGYQYPKIVEANKLANENQIEVGQVLEIPRLGLKTPSPLPIATPTILPTPPGETKGGTSQTIWGETITGTTYTVISGDWLSKIAGRAYGDVMAYTKIAQANNLQNPDLIEVGMTLKIPR